MERKEREKREKLKAFMKDGWEATILEANIWNTKVIISKPVQNCTLNVEMWKKKKEKKERKIVPRKIWTYAYRML